jgi:hypothetical protein
LGIVVDVSDAPAYPAVVRARTGARGLALTIAATLTLAAATLFVYNSGYGYDAYEYLVIGRGLGDGYPLYAFVPSKSWALYVLAAAIGRLPIGAAHAGLTLLVVAILAAIAVGTYAAVMAMQFGRRAATTAAALVAAGGVFAELNFVEPTGFVYLFGLLAFVAAIRSDETPTVWQRIAAGAWLGIGAAFKAVAGMYLIAVVAWLIAGAVARRRPLITPFRHAIWVIAAFVVTLGAQAAYFWITGRLQPYVEWTFVFPFFYYPSHLQWLSKLYTKLLWVWIASAAAAVASLDPRIRRSVYHDSRIWLLLAFGACGLLPLLKTQSSHYAFTGFAFLLVYAAVVLDRWLAAQTARPAIGFGLGCGLLAACAISGALYRPAAFERLLTVNSYAGERDLRDTIQAFVRPGDAAIFFNQGTRLYWIADRYPNWPVLNTEVQTTYYVARHAPELLAALDDPRLRLVEFDPAAATFDDASFLDHAENRAFLASMSCRLERGFVRRDDVVPSLVLWTPKPAAARAGASRSCN